MALRYEVGRHQIAITEELVVRERRCTQITNRKGAADAIAMLDFLQDYYVPGPAYRGSRESELALESQRRRTMRAYATALEVYTGKSHDLDVAAWQSWLISSGAKNR
jgi:hypothetical protein